MQTDFLQYIFQAINNLLTQNLGFFDAMGQNLFRMFATILIVWYGVKSALSAASGKQPFQFDNSRASSSPSVSDLLWSTTTARPFQVWEPASTNSSPMKRNSCRARSIRLNSKQ